MTVWRHGARTDVMSQQCGQTWLQTIAQDEQHLTTPASQLNLLQVVTWNDYEEGTEIESRQSTTA